MENLENNLNNAIKSCEGHCAPIKYLGFYQLYPFTTENISGYINEFNLKDKKLLTVGSSLDQSFNALLKGCKDQTIYDICPFIKYYFNLKKTAIEVLSYEEFCLFFNYKKFIVEYYEKSKIAKKMFENNMIFNLTIYNKLKEQLRLNDYESYLFWDELFQNFDGKIIRKSIFNADENRFDVIKDLSPYLHDEVNYNNLKMILKYLKPKFITGDIHELKLNEKYDNIFLSNIAMYEFDDLKLYKNLIDKLDKYMNINGKMLFTYLYGATNDTKYYEEWKKIYDFKYVLNLFKKYDLNFYSFIGTRGILWEDKNDQDSILIYQKKK